MSPLQQQTAATFRPRLASPQNNSPPVERPSEVLLGQGLAQRPTIGPVLFAPNEIRIKWR